MVAVVDALVLLVAHLLEGARLRGRQHGANAARRVAACGVAACGLACVSSWRHLFAHSLDDLLGCGRVHGARQYCAQLLRGATYTPVDRRDVAQGRRAAAGSRALRLLLV